MKNYTAQSTLRVNTKEYTKYMKTNNPNKGAFGVVLLVAAALVLVAAGYYSYRSTTDVNLAVDQGTNQNQPSGIGADTTVRQGVEQQVLGNTDWTWLRTEIAGGQIMAAPVGKFVISFDGEGNMTSTTDCNSLSGTFEVNGNQLTFGPFISTLMYCDGSLEGEYSGQLSKTERYIIQGQGTELRLSLSDGGVMIFAARIGE
jgi:heat shock protein HslJ